MFLTRDMCFKQKTVVHAGGFVPNDGDSSYTNSYEALVNCYQNNNRISEIDFMMSSDGKLLCAHDGGDVWAYGIDSRGPLTEEEFLKQKFFGKFTTMSLVKLADFMREHQDMYIVTDVKEDNVQACKYIADNYPDLVDRFIVQIYHIYEYESIRDLGFTNIILTLYRTLPEERSYEALRADIVSYDLVGITFWDYWTEEDFYVPLKKECLFLSIQ